jgi:hypothetical protein
MDNLRLAQLFSTFGPVGSATIDADPLDSAGHRSGQVQMSSAEDARQAIAALDAHLIDGVALTVVSEDAEAALFPPRYGNGRSGRTGVRSGAGMQDVF